MFGETSGGMIGTQVPAVSSWTAEDFTFFLFQLTFCGTATTIVSGAVAERMSFLGYFITSMILSVVIYPVTGHWAWGGIGFDLPMGWLRQLQYRDMDFWPNRSDREVFLRQVRQQQRVANFEACLRKVNGSVFWSLISGLEILYNQCSCVLFSFSDISTQIQRESILRFLASTDPLTGISNRRAFFEQGESLLASSSQGIWPLSILMLDIDHFKQVNDRWGHAKGDQVIQYLANSCSSILGDRDLVGRLGGEEFAILLVNTPVTVAQSIAERLRDQIEQTPALAQSDPISITISVGLARIQLGDTLGSALQRADAALYQAKSKGRNRVEIYLRDP